MIITFNDAGAVKTAKDYSAMYAEARRMAAKMDIATRKKLADVYLKAADEAAAVVKRTLERGLSRLTAERWAVMAANLKDAADMVASGTEREAKALIARTAPLFPEIDSALIWDAAKAAGATDRITKTGLGRMVAGVNKDVMQSLVSRMWKDGYKFSDRVWSDILDDAGRPLSVRGSWQDSVRMTIAAGIAQGRDPAKIAKDIQAYTSGGKIALSKRWGALERGTSEFAKRLPGRIDWRAQRLVRSELYASLQDASLAAGSRNPANDGLFDWVLSGGRQHWDCECASLAAGSPYKKENVPTYPHPNCLCWLRPHLMDIKEFVSDLARWAKGETVDYLDTWNRDVYEAAA